ncbi:response regulator transcription factor [Azospirillum ramasamyi]|uniref:HTH luxR-type domain-containing protein n=1 Tax=Azospirillum ramasamyi TaxID=682998 RepID=A0A2U9SFD2_9PROT|nr:response regulator transcription factor [Azospirillum ramasamyi]AWU98094.1 hypothetical protein DM194_27805 [Azospirillum ramasamyi]
MSPNVPALAATVAQPSPLTRAAIVSADFLAGQGLVRLVERAAPTAHVEVLASIWTIDRSADYGLVVLHAPAPDAETEFLIAHLRTLRHPPAIAVIAPPTRSGNPATLLTSGADLLLTGQEAPHALQAALASVAAGFCVVPASVARSEPCPPTSADAADTALHPFGTDLAYLTPRQRIIAALIAEGLPNKRIAERLGISEGTVKVHGTAIYRALAVRSRTELVCRLLRSPALSDTIGEHRSL